ncbi:hypothetical protein EOL72_00890 [Candidatus Falkowbacteria bacterium]|jgi:hypothetical protein|nr:hypothetical protein [Patescibacteria group bacterium]MDD3435437.1 hypothetical protein [Patescibacteria group bacterium]MDD4466718.1 hypothetical protein [Patescibacteria group bacterium]NCU42899.1 hypothetical protein [Candidatus Falkowbacteria bacterium]
MKTNFSSIKNEHERALLKSLVFFDLFSYPLSLWEWWQNLEIKISFKELSETVDYLLEGGQVERREGWYFLPGRQEIVLERRQRYNFTNQKIKRAKKAARLFRLVPSVKLVAISNLIGHHNLREGSDIDLFIISSPGRLWLTRFFCAGLMKILRWRPQRDDKQDKICLSFYAATTGLAMDSLRLDGGDAYFEHWLMGLHPIYDKGRYLDYLHYKNPWLKELFPNSYLLRESFSADYFSRNLLDRLLFSIANVAEPVVKKIQFKILPPALASQIGKGTGVILSDHLLRFYLDDRRLELQNRYLDRLASLGLYD